MINKVTIAGADSPVNIRWMQEVSQAYPFVEWGILSSSSRRGEPRYPNLKWMFDLAENVGDMKLSLHLCGKWVRDVGFGNWLPVISSHSSWLLQRFRRAQLNIPPDFKFCSVCFPYQAKILANRHNWQLIIQNTENLLELALQNNIDAVPLFDASGGRGLVPESRPAQTRNIYTGYAGGLTPENVIEEASKIQSVASIWLDVESGVRTSDNELDPKRVEKFLVNCQKLVYD